jgi:hypothetical protein
VTNFRENEGREEKRLPWEGSLQANDSVCQCIGLPGSPMGFGKQIDNHFYVVVLHFMHYNFGRIRKSLRITPIGVLFGRNIAEWHSK